MADPVTGTGKVESILYGKDLPTRVNWWTENILRDAMYVTIHDLVSETKVRGVMPETAPVEVGDDISYMMKRDGPLKRIYVSKDGELVVSCRITNDRIEDLLRQ